MHQVCRVSIHTIQEQHELVDCCSQAGSQQWAQPENPHATPIAGPLIVMVGFGRRHLGDHFTHHGSCARLFGLGCFHASQRHQSWAEGTCGVDGAAIDGNQKTVGHEDGQANGDARLAAVHGTLGIAGGLEHHEDQQGGTHGFANQSVPPVPLGTQTVGAQDACHVQLWREDGHQNRRAADGAQHLTTEVQDALQHITVPSEDQSQGR
mmetsp:Transcript_4054/g.4750  ORF Transcript_4054/g.4750 Transcript_4054/m.4750 type:complete len:208 (-) Transcript_4054:3-626(-)